MSAARELFDEIVSGGYGSIQRMVAEKWQEDLLLEFKLADKNQAPMTEIDKKNFAKEMGAFANSDGGVIVWGVYASSSSPQDPDAASNVEPIKDLDLFMSNLRNITGQIVSPGVIGVEHYSIPDPNDQSKGFAISYIPRGEGEPHMSRAKDQYCFFYRSGSSSLKMESYMLADRYGRRPQPKLELTKRIYTESIQVGDNRGGTAVVVVWGMKNAGLGIARFPALEVENHPSFRFHKFSIDGNHGPELRLETRENNSSKPYFFAGLNGEVIYPDRTLEIAIFKAEIKNTEDNLAPVSVKCRLFCDGFAAAKEESFYFNHILANPILYRRN